MKLVTPNEMKLIDQMAIEKHHIPGTLLMDNASMHIALKAREMIKKGSSHGKGSIVLIAGKGNNGGDAYAAARHLFQWGYSVDVVSVLPQNEAIGDAQTFLKILESLSIPITYATSEDHLSSLTDLFEKADLLVDGVFGTGFHGKLSSFFYRLILQINQCPARKLSIDIPSGVNGDSGQIDTIAVKADETVTFSHPKPGLLQYPGMEYTGKLTVVDIGIPRTIIEQMHLNGEWFDAATAAQCLPIRPQDGHKGTFGKVLLVTGSNGMTGAGTLAARAAFKTGSGVVYIAAPQSLAGIYNNTIPEAITVPLPEEHGVITKDAVEMLNEMTKAVDIVVIGPGLSTKPQVRSWAARWIVLCKKPIVIDADALNLIAETPGILNERAAPSIVTPHPGEFARLVGKKIEEVQRNRIREALEYSHSWGVTVVLKGAGTIIACPDGRYTINTTGHSGMAVAGSGDVLSGIIGSLAGQGLPLEKAASLGVFIHGRCGESVAMQNCGEAGFLARELCDHIPCVISSIRQEKKGQRNRPLEPGGDFDAQ